jgi:hypothetical protein
MYVCNVDNSIFPVSHKLFIIKKRDNILESHDEHRVILFVSHEQQTNPSTLLLLPTYSLAAAH